jgi:hypothetical protein
MVNLPKSMCSTQGVELSLYILEADWVLKHQEDDADG